MRCIKLVTTKKNKKTRQCKNKANHIHGYCHTHDEYPGHDEYGRCCFCGSPCNQCSQACGRCARSL